MWIYQIFSGLLLISKLVNTKLETSSSGGRVAKHHWGRAKEFDGGDEECNERA